MRGDSDARMGQVRRLRQGGDPGMMAIRLPDRPAFRIRQKQDSSGYDCKVMRGGSGRDRPRRARASWRWGYYDFQAVSDVGFRVVRVSEAAAKRKGAEVG